MPSTAPTVLLTISLNPHNDPKSFISLSHLQTVKQAEASSSRTVATGLESGGWRERILAQEGPCPQTLPPPTPPLGDGPSESQGGCPHLLRLSVTTEALCLSLMPRPTPCGQANAGRGRGGRGAYLVHVEVEEDTSSHLGDEDQEEEDKVLGTQSRKSAGSLLPGPTSDAPHPVWDRAGLGAGQAVVEGLLTSPSRQRTSFTAPMQPRKPMSMVTAPTPMKT